MSRPFKLFRLQQIDSQIDSIHSRLHEIEIALQEDSILKQAVQLSETARHALEDAHKALILAESELNQQQVKIEQTEATLYGGKVKNPKELQELQNEVSALKRHKIVLEERLLTSMMLEEEAVLTNQNASADLEKTRALFNQRNNEMAEEQIHLLKELSHIEAEQSAAIGSIQVEDLELYHKLRQLRRGIAVSKVSDRACSACGSILSAALLHNAHSPSQISRCETCGRILYLG
jgi:predicted  nucleic acid-binding Zn-ribbon protein